jgi:hypothetical protein
MRVGDLYRLNDGVRDLLDALGIAVEEDDAGDRMVDDVTHAIAGVLDRARDGDKQLRDAGEIRGVVDAAEIVQAMYRNGELAHLGLATASGRERYASGVQEALRWVLGEEPWADLERLIKEED